MGRLDGKVALITGSSSGIGKAIALLFAKEGAKVVVTAHRSVEGAEETVRMIKEAGGEAAIVKADVSQAVDVAKMVKTTVDTYGQLDILCNNAGIVEKEGLMAEVAEETWDRIIDVNLKGVFLGMKYSIPEMLKRGGGVIINIGSTASLVAFASLPIYCTSKAGIVMLTKATAIGYATQNIRVNCICPGNTLTRMTVPFWGSVEAAAQPVPMGRVGKPEEIAQAALFLACDESSYITGTALVVDGGYIL